MSPEACGTLSSSSSGSAERWVEEPETELAPPLPSRHRQRLAASRSLDTVAASSGNQQNYSGLDTVAAPSGNQQNYSGLDTVAAPGGNQQNYSGLDTVAAPNGSQRNYSGQSRFQPQPRSGQQTPRSDAFDYIELSAPPRPVTENSVTTARSTYLTDCGPGRPQQASDYSSTQSYAPPRKGSLPTTGGTHQPDTLRHHPDTLRHHPDTLHHQPDTLRQHPDTLRHQPDAVRQHPDTLRHQPDTVRQHPASHSVAIPRGHHVNGDTSGDRSGRDVVAAYTNGAVKMVNGYTNGGDHPARNGTNGCMSSTVDVMKSHGLNGHHVVQDQRSNTPPSTGSGHAICNASPSTWQSLSNGYTTLVSGLSNGTLDIDSNRVVANGGRQPSVSSRCGSRNQDPSPAGLSSRCGSRNQDPSQAGLSSRCGSRNQDPSPAGLNSRSGAGPQINSRARSQDTSLNSTNHSSGNNLSSLNSTNHSSGNNLSGLNSTNHSSGNNISGLNSTNHSSGNNSAGLNSSGSRSGLSLDSELAMERCLTARSVDDLSAGSVSPSQRRRPLCRETSTPSTISAGSWRTDAASGRTETGSGRPDLGSGRTASPRTAAEARLRPGSGGAARTSVQRTSACLQQELLRLINPDDCGSSAPAPAAAAAATAAPPLYEQRRRELEMRRQAAERRRSREMEPGVIVTTARPATVIASSADQRQQQQRWREDLRRLSREERLSPRVTAGTGTGAGAGSAGPGVRAADVPLPPAQLDWEVLVDTATRATRDTGNNSRSTSDYSRVAPVPDQLQSRLSLLENELLTEQSKRQLLESQVHQLSTDNRRLQEESRQAAHQLRKFTEWFFNNIEKP